MPDWTASMQRSYEYYTVDANTWHDISRLTNVKSSTVNRDSQAGSLGSASIDLIDSLGECYIRTYLITNQNGSKERHCLGTHLVQTPSSSFNGKVRSTTADAYTPLIELKENQPPLGYTVRKGSKILDAAYDIVSKNVRAPVIKNGGVYGNDQSGNYVDISPTLETDFVANVNDTWLTFVVDLLANAKYELALDEMSRILFAPIQDTASLQPVWTYTDDNSSILYPDLTMLYDLYNIPNVVEVIYSNGSKTVYSTIVNDDPNSPTSTVNRGRKITRRITDPSIAGAATQDRVDEYAKQALRTLSTIEYEVSYTHAYCPVRVGDCVRFNHKSAGLTNVKGKVISQGIKCSPACPVSEKALIVAKLWG